MRKIYLYCLALLVVCGCQGNVARPVDYPATWPESLQHDDVCAPIDGIYAYEGQKYSGAGQGDAMSGMGPAIGGYLINGSPGLVEIRAGVTPVSHVFTVYGDGMSAHIGQHSRYKSVSSTLLVIEKTLRCVGGRYAEGYEYNSAAEGMAHRGRAVYYYSKDAEGSLVIEVSYTDASSGSLFVLDKKTLSGNAWYKFENRGQTDIY